MRDSKHMASVRLSEVVEKMHLKNLTPGIDLNEIRIRQQDINRPALQLAGYLEQHPVLYYYTPTQSYRLDVFAMFVTGGGSDVYAFNFSTRNQFQEFINRMRSRSNFDTDVEVTSSDHIMTLSTCSYEYDDARYVVLCKIVPM